MFFFNHGTFIVKMCDEIDNEILPLVAIQINRNIISFDAQLNYTQISKTYNFQYRFFYAQSLILVINYCIFY